MNITILVVFTIKIDSMPDNIQEIMNHEKQLIESLPLYQFVQSVEYYPLIQQF
jgi:hypothetical protein